MLFPKTSFKNFQDLKFSLFSYCFQKHVSRIVQEFIFLDFSSCFQNSCSRIVQELIKTRVQKVKNADKVSLDAIKGRTGMIEVMEAINNSEIALQEIVTVRDKIVAAYLDILKMPL